MKLKKIKRIIYIAFSIMLIAGCKKMANKQPNVTFNAGSLIYMVNDSTFYKYIDGLLWEFTPSNSKIILNDVDIPMYDSLTFSQVNNKLTVILGDFVFFKFEGIADGVVLYTGDSVKGVSHRYEDYPTAKGEAATLDPKTHIGNETYKYRDTGTFNVQMVARNFWEESEDKEQIVSIQVTVLDDTEYNYILK